MKMRFGYMPLADSYVTLQACCVVSRVLRPNAVAPSEERRQSRPADTKVMERIKRKRVNVEILPTTKPLSYRSALHRVASVWVGRSSTMHQSKSQF